MREIKVYLARQGITLEPNASLHCSLNGLGVFWLIQWTIKNQVRWGDRT